MKGRCFSIIFAGEIGEQDQEKEIEARNEYIENSSWRIKVKTVKCLISKKKSQTSALAAAGYRKNFETLYLAHSINKIIVG